MVTCFLYPLWVVKKEKHFAVVAVVAVAVVVAAASHFVVFLFVF